ncbi:MAG: adenine phosphoribosyltransferase, partial [Megasphaera micronuciformis]|nr:adenine phosphoribosyltransferase [Megasphaera micronuciformis]
MAKEYYELHVAGCTRQLPILNVTDSLAIAGFVILGDTELTVNTAKELAAKLPAEADMIMTAETKGIPLAAEMARILGMPHYIVARKSIKAYMENPLIVDDESITTKGK